MFKNRRLIFSALLLTFSSGTSQNVFASASTTVYIIPDILPSCSMIETAHTLQGYTDNNHSFNYKKATTDALGDINDALRAIKYARYGNKLGSSEDNTLIKEKLSTAIQDGPAAFKKTLLELKKARIASDLLSDAISSLSIDELGEQAWLGLALLMLLVYSPATDDYAGAEENFYLFVSQFLTSDKTAIALPARTNSALLEATFELLISEDFGYSTIANNLWKANQTLYQDFKELNNLFKK